MKYSLADTHCHLDFLDFDLDREDVIKRAREAGLEYIVNIGSSLDGSKRSLELSRHYDCVYATVGIHPHEADTFDAQGEETIRRLAKEKKVVAIGEIGLDFFRNLSKADNQIAMFKSLIKVAKDLSLPLVIHSRQAEDQVLEILEKAMPIGAVIHCFSADENFLKKCLELGFFISFTCNITYKKADNLRRLVTGMPLERLFLETDAPYLSPEGFRGKRNEPVFVKLLAEEIARLRGITAEEVGRVTTENAKQFFKL